MWGIGRGLIRRLELSAALVSTLAAVLVQTTDAGALPTTTLQPPYAHSFEEGYCSSGFGFVDFEIGLPPPPGAPRCWRNASADETTGSIGIDLGIISPGEGLLPSAETAYAYGRAGIVATHSLKTPVTELLYTITIHITSAEVRHEGSQFGGGSAEINVFAYATHSACEDCFGGIWRDVVELTCGPRSLSNEDLTLQFSFTSRSAQIPPGVVEVEVGAYGFESLRGTQVSPSRGTVTLGDTGMVQALLDAGVSTITAEVPHPDRPRLIGVVKVCAIAIQHGLL